MLKVSLLFRNRCWYIGWESRHPVHVVQHDGAATHWTHVVRSNVDKTFCDLGGGGIAWPPQSTYMTLCDCASW